jgi:hypothetical protein
MKDTRKQDAIHPCTAQKASITLLHAPGREKFVSSLRDSKIIKAARQTEQDFFVQRSGLTILFAQYRSIQACKIRKLII